MFWNGKDKKADAEDTSLGNVLLDLGHISRDDLKQALEIQKSKAPRIGEILIELELATEDQVYEAVLKQKMLRGKASDREITDFHRHLRKKAFKAANVSVDNQNAAHNDLLKLLSKADG